MIKIRPHHVLCNYCYRGNGYNKAFVHNFTQINEDIISNKKPFIIVNKLDSICSKCPNHNGIICNTQEKVNGLDSKHMQALQIQDGDILNWEQSIKKIKDHITEDVFNNICHDCEWYKSNICYNVMFPSN